MRNTRLTATDWVQAVFFTWLAFFTYRFVRCGGACDQAWVDLFWWQVGLGLLLVIVGVLADRSWRKAVFWVTALYLVFSLVSAPASGLNSNVAGSLLILVTVGVVTLAIPGRLRGYWQSMKTSRRYVLGLVTVLSLGLVIGALLSLPLRRQEPADQRWMVHLPLDPRTAPSVCTMSDGNDVVADDRNRIWIAWGCTRAGVSMFDGTGWTHYTADNSGLPPEWVERLAVDSQGRVWMAHFTSGGYPSRPSMEPLTMFDGIRWTSYLPGKSTIHTLAADGGGRVWIGISSTDWLQLPWKDEGGVNLDFGRWAGVAVFDGSIWTAYTSRNSGLGRDFVKAISIDGRDRAWIATDTGVSVFDGKSWVTYSDEELGLPFVTAIAFDKDGMAWLGTKSGGLLSYDGKRWTVRAKDTSSSSVENLGTVIRDIAFDATGGVWLCCPGNTLRVYDGQSWTIVKPEDIPPSPSIPLAIAADHQGQIWVVTHRAVSVLKP